MGLRFFVGTSHPYKARHLARVMVSANVLRKRKSHFTVGEWIMDSGAFTIVNSHGGYPDGVDKYAEIIRRFADCGQLQAAVAQDYMCEPHVLSRTGLTVAEHQRLTIERYDALMNEDVGGALIMPVLQGYEPAEYAQHVVAYGDRLAVGAWVGVGSVCKRNTNPESILDVLEAVHEVRPDLQLHGFGIKITALNDRRVREHLASCDSMAWSYAAMRKGRNTNNIDEAIAYAERVQSIIDEPPPPPPPPPPTPRYGDFYQTWGIHHAPRLLDLFCGAGGASAGYAMAGFEVVGVDIDRQPEYPYEFVRADALKLDSKFIEQFDVIHASPPCQAHTTMSNRWKGKGSGHDSRGRARKTDSRPNLIPQTRDLLVRSGLPYVIENVAGARKSLVDPFVLTGGMFGLRVHRPRLFEVSVAIRVPPPSEPPSDVVGVYGERPNGRVLWRRADGTELRAPSSLREAQEAMGMPWASWAGLAEAVPPAYTECIGNALVVALS